MAPREGDAHQRTNHHGYAYGMRFGEQAIAQEPAEPAAEGPRAARRDQRHGAGLQAWNSIFRPGSVFRKGYTDSPRNRSYVIMNWCCTTCTR